MALAGPRLLVRPLTYRYVCSYIHQHHRHHKPPQGGKVFLGVSVHGEDRICGVMVIGRPLARHLDTWWTFEVTRTCTDGTVNANSCLYGAARRVGFGMGYWRGITYLQDGESGVSLRAAGWRKVKDLPARGSWAASSVTLRALRDPVGTGGVARALWECVRGDGRPPVYEGEIIEWP